MGLLDRLANALGEKLDVLHHVRGFRVVVDNTRPDIATADVLARLDESLALVEQFQPWRLAHLRRDLDHIRVVRWPCRGAFFPDARACMVELTFLARRDIGPATVASTIVHEGMHARVNAMKVRDEGRDRAREERICRRAELEFGQALPAAIGAPVVDRAMESLALDDTAVAPEIDWRVAEQRMAEVDRDSRNHRDE
jgi:hypothetical protein